MRGWFTTDSYTDEQIDKNIDIMLGEGTIEEIDGRIYMTEKGHYEFMYGKYAQWEDWKLKKPPSDEKDSF